ncbi:hypothetical protein vseg_011873 [Gypsophila vaccaria]
MAPDAFHPALEVNNNQHHISIKLGLDTDQYQLWVALFTNHTKSSRVLHHIVTPKGGSSTPPTTDDEKELWETLDATCFNGYIPLSLPTSWKPL